MRHASKAPRPSKPAPQPRDRTDVYARRTRTLIRVPWIIFVARVRALATRVFHCLRARYDIPVLFRAPPGGAGLATGTSCACGELAHFLCATLRAFPSSARRVRGAPFGAHRARGRERSNLFGLAPGEAGMAVNGTELFRGPCAAVRTGRSGPKGGRNGLRPPFGPPRQGWRVGKPGRPARIFRPWMDEKRSTGVAFLLVTSLWPNKEKLPARAGCARKRTGMSNVPEQ